MKCQLRVVVSSFALVGVALTMTACGSPRSAVPSAPTISPFGKAPVARSAVRRSAVKITLVGSGWIYPNSLAVDSRGNVYVTDTTEGVYREGTVTKVSPPFIGSTNGKMTVIAHIASPGGIVLDGKEDAYVFGSDNGGNRCIVQITPQKVVNRVYCASDTGVMFFGLAVDSKEDVYAYEQGLSHNSLKVGIFEYKH